MIDHRANGARYVPRGRTASIVSPNGGPLENPDSLGTITYQWYRIRGCQRSSTADGDIEVISSGKTVSWYENNGTGIFSKNA